MSTDNQNAIADPMDTLSVQPMKQASDIVQSMESRGDFKYKGISKVFQLILDWTKRYDTNGVLASFEQIMKEHNLDEPRAKEYMTELLGRGMNHQAVVQAFPAVQFVKGSGKIESMVVFCRPEEKEGTSVQRYYHGVIDRNYKALAHWIDTRGRPDPKQLRDALGSAIQAGRLRDSRARAEVARLMQNPLDTTHEQKQSTNILIVRPVLKRLLETKKLVLLQASAPDGQQFNAVYFNRSEELEERFNALGEYFFQNIVREKREVTPENAKAALEGVAASRYNQLEEGQKQVVQEIMLLSGFVQKQAASKQEESKREELEKALEQLHKFPHVVDRGQLKNVPEEEVTQLRSVSGVLHADYALRGKIFTFFLHKDQIGPAVDFARDKFDKHGDDSDVRILSAMGLERYLDKDRYKAFLDLEQRCLFNQLPLMVRIWRMLTGNRKLREKEIVQLKNKIKKDQEQEQVRVRTSEVRKQQKELVSKRMKGESDEEGGSEGNGSASGSAGGKSDSKGSIEPPDSEEQAEATKERMEQEERAKELLRKIVDILDDAWKNKQFPNREDLIEGIDEFDEDSLIMFLKKYGRKEVLSFRIKHDRPEYVWPILISRRFLKRNGKKLLEHYSTEADKQRNASMPDQHKFDVANSVEDFLARVLPKL